MRRSFGCFIATLLLPAALPAWAQPCYRVTPIVPPASKPGVVIPIAINDRGEVTGQLRVDRDDIFIWSEQGGMHVLPPRHTSFGCYVTAINNAGQVTGQCEAAVQGDVQHGLSLLEENSRDAASSGSSINSAGKIVGHRAALNGGYDAFLYEPCCGMRGLMPHEPGASVWARFINTNGLVIGFDSMHPVPFVWSSDSGVRYLYAAATANERAFANGLSDNGIVLLDVWREITTTADDPRAERGSQYFSQMPSDGVAVDAPRPPYRTERHAYLYDLASNQRSPISNLAGGDENTQGLQINGRGEVVGSSGASNDAMRAFYWHPQTGMLQLDQMIDRRDSYRGIALHSALGINNLGQILAVGNKGAKVYLLTPVETGECVAHFSASNVVGRLAPPVTHPIDSILPNEEVAMSDTFAPCHFYEHEPNAFSITFSAIDDFIEYLESQGGQGGGYTWESMVTAVLEMRSIVLEDVDFDPEGDMFAAASANKASLQTIAHIIKELAENHELMAQAIAHAKDGGYFE